MQIVYHFKNKKPQELLTDGTLQYYRLSGASPWGTQEDKQGGTYAYWFDDENTAPDFKSLQNEDIWHKREANIVDTDFYCPTQIPDISALERPFRYKHNVKLWNGKVLKIIPAIIQPKKMLWGWNKGEDRAQGFIDPYGRQAIDIETIYNELGLEVGDLYTKETLAVDPTNGPVVYSKLADFAYLSLSRSYRITPELLEVYDLVTEIDMQRIIWAALSLEDEAPIPKS